jgi:hypothetical protein
MGLFLPDSGESGGGGEVCPPVHAVLLTTVLRHCRRSSGCEGECSAGEGQLVPRVRVLSPCMRESPVVGDGGVLGTAGAGLRVQSADRSAFVIATSVLLSVERRCLDELANISMKLADRLAARKALVNLVSLLISCGGSGLLRWKLLRRPS